MYLCQHPLTYGRRSGVYTNTTLSDPPHIPRPSNVLYSLLKFSRLAVLDYLIHIYSKIITKLSWIEKLSIYLHIEICVFTLLVWNGIYSDMFIF